MKSCDTTCAPVTPSFTALALAYCVAAILNGVLVVVKETVPAVKQTMYAITGHHWTTQTVVLLAVMMACYVLFKSINLGQRMGLGFGCCLRYMVTSTLIGLVMMTAQYVAFGL